MTADDATGPAGIPVGRALSVPLGIANDDLWLAIDAIDRVHGDGSPPSVRVQLANLSAVAGRRRRGRIVFDSQSHVPTTIFIASNETHHAFTFLHEIGHLIDLCGVGDFGRFESSDGHDLQAWRLTVGRSVAVQQLLDLAEPKEPVFLPASSTLLPPDLDRA